MTQNLTEVAGNLHMHTRHSDGQKWHVDLAHAAIAAGLDFIIVTDHNKWVEDVEGYYKNEHGQVLLLSGEEVHDVHRHPQCNHMLIYGAEEELASFAQDPQQLINEAHKRNALSFLAHPYDLPLPAFSKQELGWHDWHVQNFTGLEIWNYMTSFKCEMTRLNEQAPIQKRWFTRLQAALATFNPEKHITGPEKETLAKWDELLKEGKRVIGIGNSDAHANPMSLGPITRIIFPYEHCFQAVNTHLLLPQPLTGETAHDKPLLLQALKKGNAFVSYDKIHSPHGFRFSGKGRTTGIMGDEIVMDVGATLQVLAPTPCHIRLIRYGEVVAEAQNDINLTHIPVETGAYRAECYLPHKGKERGWIYSNPIYLIE